MEEASKEKEFLQQLGKWKRLDFDGQVVQSQTNTAVITASQFDSGRLEKS